MKTPIYDFLSAYAEGEFARFHMPGHKGRGPLGIEKYDLTEIPGADTLYFEDGIIAQSEAYAASLFGARHTFYSTEGSTLAIKAMLAAATFGKKRARVLSARGAHKAFVYAAAILDIDVVWVYPNATEHLCFSKVSAEAIDLALSLEEDISAVYITSPDYLGNISDVRGISEVCKKHGVPLLCDNAHGAYLGFLSPSRHPISLGADMCCDSAHKTLSAVTGAAYLHISEGAPGEFVDLARRALRLFASTSPSYLILASLDLCNRYLSDGYRERLSETVSRASKLKEKLSSLGYTVIESEELKIVLSANEYGYTGAEISEYLQKNGAVAEFFDDEYLVFMLTPENTDEELSRLFGLLSALPKRVPIAKEAEPQLPRPISEMSIREAVLSKCETVLAKDAVGRVCASPTVSCPPAVPIAVSGELITEETVSLFKKYHINEIEVVKNDR